MQPALYEDYFWGDSFYIPYYHNNYSLKDKFIIRGQYGSKITAWAPLTLLWDIIKHCTYCTSRVNASNEKRYCSWCQQSLCEKCQTSRLYCEQCDKHCKWLGPQRWLREWKRKWRRKWK